MLMNNLSIKTLNVNCRVTTLQAWTPKTPNILQDNNQISDFVNLNVRERERERERGRERTSQDTKTFTVSYVKHKNKKKLKTKSKKKKGCMLQRERERRSLIPSSVIIPLLSPPPSPRTLSGPGPDGNQKRGREKGAERAED